MVIKKAIFIIAALLLISCVKSEPVSTIHEVPLQDYTVTFKSENKIHEYTFEESYELGLCAITTYRNKVLYVYRIGEKTVLRYIYFSEEPFTLISYSSNFKEIIRK